MPNLIFFSTDKGASITPKTLDPAPATLIELEQLPVLEDGAFDEQAGEHGRGSVIKTLGGVVVQDFGVVVSDGHIVFSDTDALGTTTVAALKTIHETVDGQYYLTDGASCWKVQFARPNGFIYRKNLFWAQHSTVIYSYSIDLVIIEKSI